MIWFGWGFMFWGPMCLVLLAVGVYYIVSSFSRGASCSEHSHSQQPQHYGGRAIELLKERYAKGEISKEEFMQMKKELQQ